MKRILLVALVMLPFGAAAGESANYRTSITVDSNDVPVFMWQLNQNLSLGVTPELLADSAKALARDQEFSEEIQIHVEGVVGIATYAIAKTESGAIVVSFTSGAWSVVPICEQMQEFSEENESALSPSKCEAKMLESVET